jgi:hypothetical protein
MSDWAVGDRALCVEDGVFIDHVGDRCGARIVGQLVRGRVYLVRRVGFLAGHTVLDIGLSFPKAAARFRKIRPDSHEGNAEDWREILKQNTRKVNAYDPFGPLGIAAE